MSSKQRLADAIAELPDSVTIEEAVERLYRAFKLKLARDEQQRKTPSTPVRRRPGSAKGVLHLSADFDAPLSDFADYR